MGSDRENPGAPNPNGPSGGPQVEAVQKKNIGQGLWYVKMSFSDHQNSVKSLQSPGNGISETLDSKIFRVSMPWTLLKKLVYIRRSTRAFDTYTRGAFENFEPGAPWYNVTPLLTSTYKYVSLIIWNVIIFLIYYILCIKRYWSNTTNYCTLISRAYCLAGIYSNTQYLINHSENNWT
jgi:hypothetical protein